MGRVGAGEADPNGSASYCARRDVDGNHRPCLDARADDRLVLGRTGCPGQGIGRRTATPGAVLPNPRSGSSRRRRPARGLLFPPAHPRRSESPRSEVGTLTSPGESRPVGSGDIVSYSVEVEDDLPFAARDIARRRARSRRQSKLDRGHVPIAYSVYRDSRRSESDWRHLRPRTRCALPWIPAGGCPAATARWSSSTLGDGRTGPGRTVLISRTTAFTWQPRVRTRPRQQPRRVFGGWAPGARHGPADQGPGGLHPQPVAHIWSIQLL